MNNTDRKIVKMIEAIRGKGNGQSIYVAEVKSLNPFSIKLYDQTITKHIYVNRSFLKTTSSEIDNNIDWNENHDYVPYSLLSFTRKMFKEDLLSVGDKVIVLLDGVSFYVLERVVKVA